jgi:hypothetical protein
MYTPFKGVVPERFRTGLLISFNKPYILQKQCIITGNGQREDDPSNGLAKYGISPQASLKGNKGNIVALKVVPCPLSHTSRKVKGYLDGGF